MLCWLKLSGVLKTPFVLRSRAIQDGESCPMERLVSTFRISISIFLLFRCSLSQKNILHWSKSIQGVSVGTHFLSQVKR